MCKNGFQENEFLFTVHLGFNMCWADLDIGFNQFLKLKCYFELCDYRSTHVLVALQKSLQSGEFLRAMANNSLVAGRTCKYII